LFAVPAFAGGNFYSYTIGANDAVLKISIQNRRYIKILTFVQSGPDNCVQGSDFSLICTSGEVTVTQTGKDPAVVQARNESSTTGRDVFVTGPAMLTVNPVPGATLFLTIFQDSN